MSGLLALLDDVAAIAKVAAASVDDVAGQAAKAGAKAAGAVVDDAAVTPQYMRGIDPKRELPMVGRIALGSIRNKLLVLLPVALLLSAFAPGAITPLLMLGGLYLCFEGGEKVWHWMVPGTPKPGGTGAAEAPEHLEEAKVKGAIKTDFILSAEIMTIALSALPGGNLWITAASLVLVAIGITAAVYGSVAVIVKLDDLGVLMARRGRFAVTRRLGRALVQVMPGFLAALMLVGTIAMLWVGGQIVLHGLAALGWEAPEHLVKLWAEAAAGAVPGEIRAATDWVAFAGLSALFGLVLGLAMLAPGRKIIAPLWRTVLGWMPWG
ncbi:MAG TPA: DUF808 family protein [Aliiroseovarius sp.]|nr:DUF808 family protein [Aliiroseovarius sp.]